MNKSGIKRLLSIIIVIVLLAFIPAGCGGGGEGPGGSGLEGGANSVPIDVNGVLSQAEFEIPAAPAEYILAQNVGAAAVQQYVYARLKLEQLLSQETVEMFSVVLDETVVAFEFADEFAGKAAKMAEYAELALDGEAQAVPASMIVRGKTSNPFIQEAYAADSPQDAKKWAEELSKKFDAAQGNQKIRVLSEQLGVDAKEAYKQLLAAQEIIKKGADADAAFFDTAMKAAMVTKSTCKVGMVVTSAIATGGLSLSVSSVAVAAETSVLLINGIDAIVDVAQTASTITLGEDHAITKKLDQTAENIAPIVAVTGLLTCNFKAAANIGKLTTIKDKAEAVGAIQYFAETGVGLSQGQFMGFDLSNLHKGELPKAVVTQIETPVEAGQVDVPALNEALNGAGLPPVPAADPDPIPMDDFIFDFRDEFPHDPVGVSEQIAEALQELEKMLIELGKLEALIDIEGAYTGTTDVALVFAGTEQRDTFSASVVIGEVDIEGGSAPIVISIGGTTWNTTASIEMLDDNTVRLTGNNIIQGDSMFSFDFKTDGKTVVGSLTSTGSPGGNPFGAIVGDYTFNVSR